MGSPVAASEFGVYEGGGCNGVKGVEAFARGFGVKPDRVLEFMPIATWDQVNSGALAWGLDCWSHAGHPPLTLTVPLTVWGTDLSAVADGQFDSAFSKIGRLLMSRGYGDAVLRIGPEMNGGWFPWGLHGDKGQGAAAYKAAFRHVVTVFRQIAGAHFQIEWCPAAGDLGIDQPALYPGDDVVDVVGTDLYAVVWGVNAPTASQVEAELKRGWHLDAVAAFGRRHGKPISFPEWGVGDRPVGHANYGPGDSPEVMSFMINWFAAHTAPRGRAPRPGEIAYTDYWDYNAGDYNARITGGGRPREAEVLRQALRDGSLTGG